MTAFDTAWDLLKMPIVPHSLKEEETKYPFTYYSALFDDPETGERLPMEAVFEEATKNRWDKHLDQIRAMILDGKGEPSSFDSQNYRRDARSQAEFARPKSYYPVETNASFFRPSDVLTDFEHQGKGYANAIYDMVASILNRRENLPLVPSDMQSYAAQEMWKDREEWPVRDDL